MKSSLSFPFSMYVDRNSSMVSIKNHFIWESKDLKTLFHFALYVGTGFHSVPNNRAQWSICKCALSFINKCDSIRDKSTVPRGWDRCTAAFLYECTPTFSLKKSEPTDIIGSCDQGRIKLSTQFLNFSVTINHLCLEECFLFTSKQVPVDRLSISLSVLQYTHTRIQTWTASERDALLPSPSHEVNVPFVKLSFHDTDQQGSPKDLKGLLFPWGRLELTSSPPCPEQAQLISITGCWQHLLRCTAKVTALLCIPKAREQSTGCYCGESPAFVTLLLAGVVLKVSIFLLALNWADKQRTSESWRRTGKG